MSRQQQFRVPNYPPLSVVSALAYSAGRAEELGSLIVIVTWSQEIFTDTNFHNGVTIQVGASPLTISSSAKTSATVVEYTLSTPVEIQDVDVNFDYDDNFGDLKDGSGNYLGDLTDEVITNLVGSVTLFDDSEYSSLVGALL